jgi:hypothetical protein
MANGHTQTREQGYEARRKTAQARMATEHDDQHNCPHCGQDISDYVKSQQGDGERYPLENAVVVPPPMRSPLGSAKQTGAYGVQEAERERAVHATGKKRQDKIADLARRF